MLLESPTPRIISYSNLGLIGGLVYKNKIYSMTGAAFIPFYLFPIIKRKNPFKEMLNTFLQMSKDKEYEMNYRNIDSFINFNDSTLVDFLTSTDRDEMYFTSISNIIRTATFSYMIIARETMLSSIKYIIDPVIEEKLFSVIGKYFYSLKSPLWQKTDLLANCYCSHEELKNIAMVIKYYKKTILKNKRGDKLNLVSFLFQSNRYREICAAIMYCFEKCNMNTIADLKGTSSTIYEHSGSFLVNKRVQKNYRDALNSNRPASYLPGIMGVFFGFFNFTIRAFLNGEILQNSFPFNPSIYLMNIQGMKRSIKTNSISDIQRTSALLDAIIPSTKKSYICFSSNLDIDPALVNRHILFRSENQKSLACFFTAVKRTILNIYWEGKLTGEPIEKIITQIVYATYGKYSAKDIGWALKQRFNFLYENKDKFPFTIISILSWF